MPDHLRKQIRDRVVAVLAGGGTDAGSRVYAARTHPLRDAPGELPAICVHTRRERSAVLDPDEGARSYRRELQLHVDLHVADPGADDDIDALAAQVEPLLEADNRLNDLAWDCVLEETAIQFSNDGAKIIGFARLTYAVTYVAAASNPTTAQ